MLTEQPIPEIGFWCQAGMVLMPALDGVEAKQKNSSWQLPK